MRLIIFNLLRRLNNMGERRLVNSSAERNKNPIKEVLGQYLYPQQNNNGGQQILLEIASGTGQHIVYLAKYFPWILYQPTEVDKSLFTCIESYIQYDGVTNVNRPAYLDVRDPPDKWLDGKILENSIDYVLNINMMHISEWKCTEGLFSGCSKILKPGKFLFTYGPYAFDGNVQPESNVRFNEFLKAQNPDWGLRDAIRELEPLAAKNDILLLHKHSLPANNYLLVWQKKQQKLEDGNICNVNSK